jgi:hypothetical protein
VEPLERIDPVVRQWLVESFGKPSPENPETGVPSPVDIVARRLWRSDREIRVTVG